MRPNDEVIYAITVTGIADIDMPIVAQKLGHESKQVQSPGTITIARLYTRWRGDAAELAWQNELRMTIGDARTVIFDVQPWSHALGYPMGDMTL